MPSNTVIDDAHAGNCPRAISRFGQMNRAYGKLSYGDPGYRPMENAIARAQTALTRYCTAAGNLSGPLCRSRRRRK